MLLRILAAAATCRPCYTVHCVTWKGGDAAAAGFSLRLGLKKNYFPHTKIRFLALHCFLQSNFCLIHTHQLHQQHDINNKHKLILPCTLLCQNFTTHVREPHCTHSTSMLRMIDLQSRVLLYAILIFRSEVVGHSSSPTKPSETVHTLTVLLLPHSTSAHRTIDFQSGNALTSYYPTILGSSTALLGVLLLYPS